MIMKSLKKTISDHRYNNTIKFATRQRQPYITRAREALGWAPKVALREGL